MGEIVGVGLISHAPTIMFEEATRRELNEGNEISLVPGLVRLRDAPGEMFSDYENATGTGQAHVWFERPAGDWTA